ncbi:hypothetical protein ACFX12_040004 [Malus domestica]
MMTYVATASRPMCSSQTQVPISLIVKGTALNSNGIINCRRRNNGVCLIKAMKSSSPPRLTLSSNWDFPSATTLAPRLPRFEELDTTNMFLRQRIIFLGSQVVDMTVDLIISQLLFLDAEDPKKDIKLFMAK